MSFESAERIARALLFEGYVLYPYRASSLKNQRRWAFGTLYPDGFCEAMCENDASRTVTECLVTGASPAVRVVVKFLQLVARTGSGAPPNDGREHGDDGEPPLPWNEALERSIDVGELALPALAAAPCRLETAFEAPVTREAGLMRAGTTVTAVVTVSATELTPSIWKLSVSVKNASDAPPVATDRAQAELHALSSVHTLMSCRDGRFVSQTDPPPALAEHARACTSVGSWPVLVGEPSRADTMLSSPIVLADHPSVASASPGDLFDATEIDEILSLRILTLSDAEKREVIRTDPRARALLERTEALGEEELLALHGVCALVDPAPTRDGMTHSHARYSPGDRVVLRPARGGDVFDLALAGQAATVLGIEQDVEGRVLYTVTVDADPGQDLGRLGLPGHRFFFTVEELERAS